MKIGEHKTREGILKIYNFREKIKVGRRRKYSRIDVINAIREKGKSSETIRRTSEKEDDIVRPAWRHAEVYRNIYPILKIYLEFCNNSERS